MTLLNLGDLAIQDSDPDRAQWFLQESLRIARNIGNSYGEAAALTNLGFAALLNQSSEEAISSFRQGIELVRRIGSMYGLINCLEGLAAAAATDHPIRTATLFAVALKMRDENRMPRTLPEESLISRFIDLARKAVTQEAWRAATQRGEEMGMDEAVAYALQHSS